VCLIARKDIPANTLAEFIAYAKATRTNLNTARRRRLRLACSARFLLDGVIGSRITHVPYRGAGPAMQDLIAGRLDYMAEQISTAVQQIDAGTVKGIAILGPDRCRCCQAAIGQGAGLGDFDCVPGLRWCCHSHPGRNRAQAQQGGERNIDTPMVRER